MKTLIQTLFFPNRKKVAKRRARVSGGVDAKQIAEMARLGQILVVMSR